MSRIRTIKPDFFLDEDMAALSMGHRMLFVGLWTLADRDGRLEERPRRIKAALFPWDDVDVAPMLVELEQAGVLYRYESAGKNYIQVRSFAKHQRPHPKEAKSEIPEPTIVDKESSREKVRLSREKVFMHPVVSRGEGKEILDSGKEILEIGKESPKQSEIPLSERSNEVFDYWRDRLKKPKAVFDSKRKTKVEARLNEKRSVEELKQAVDGCAMSPWHQGENPDGVKYDDLELICRDAVHLEKFIAMATSPPIRAATKGRASNADKNWDEQPKMTADGNLVF